MDDKKRQAILKSVEYAVKKGATAVKIEAEAQLNRPSNYRDSEYCDYCDEGSQDCETCNTYGHVSCDNEDCEDGQIPVEGVMVDHEDCNDEGHLVCPDCHGDCYVTCSECHGNYEFDSEDSEDYGNPVYCLDTILSIWGVTNASVDSISSETAQASNVNEWLRFIRFYNDHSVDTEVTATIMLNNPENVFKLVSFLEAFKEFGLRVTAENGEQVDVDGAGLHMAFLFNSDGTYPDNTHRLSDAKLLNFRHAMLPLLPSLFFLGAHSGNTRSLSYRRPNVSVGVTDPHDRVGIFSRDEKYSAIHYAGHALEFRVFDTCYDTPENVLDNFVVMSNSLKFLTDKKRNTKADKLLTNREYSFGVNTGRELGRLYATSTHVDLLSAGLNVLKPSYYTIRELKAQRGFKITKRAIKKQEAMLTVNAEAAYNEFIERTKLRNHFYAMTVRGDYLRDRVNSIGPDQLRGVSPESLEEQCQEEIERRIRNWSESIPPKTSWLREYIKKRTGEMRGAYTLTLPNN